MGCAGSKQIKPGAVCAKVVLQDVATAEACVCITHRGYGRLQVENPERVLVVDTPGAARHLVYNWALTLLKTRELTIYSNVYMPACLPTFTPHTHKELHDALRDAIELAAATIKVYPDVEACEGRAL